MTFKALIFDVDGTLAETEEFHRLAFNAAFAKAGLDWSWPQDLYRRLLKVTGGKERIRHYLDLEKIDLGPGAADIVTELHAEKNRLYASQLESGVALRPGAARLIHEAMDAGLLLAIATTTSRSNLDALLQAGFGAGAASWFAAIVTGEDVSAKKPDPEAYTVALERLGLHASQCIAFEDSRNGLIAAQGAGLAVIVTPGIYTDDERFDEAECVVSDLGEPGRPLRSLAGWRPPRKIIDIAALRRMP